MFHYLLLQWPRVRAHDPEIVVLKMPVIVHDIGDKIITTYPIASMSFASSIILNDKFEITKNSINGLTNCTDPEGLENYVKGRALDYNTEDLHEWRYALLQRSITSKVLDQYESLTSYMELNQGVPSLLYNALQPFFISKPVTLNGSSFQGITSGRLSTSTHNRSNTLKSVNSDCTDCNE